jgi:hypothetical protein
MDPDEVRAEIECRRKQANDLKLRETLWALYHSHLKFYVGVVTKDPSYAGVVTYYQDMIYPEIKETLEISGADIQFRFGEATYRVTYTAGPEERSDWDSRGRYREEVSTPITLALAVNGERVFEFEMTEIVTDTMDGPLFDEVMGKVTSFIEGPWVTDVAQLVQKIKAHEQSIRDKQLAQKREQQLREDMKRFGL